MAHSLYKTKFYKAWQAMKTRCYNSKVDSYKTHGARGIRVCDRWLHSFWNFYEDMYESFSLLQNKSLKISLDRIDNNGNYEPNNCRWATQKEQANNRRSNKMITLNGKTQSLAMWCEKAVISPSLVRSRFYCLKWSLEKSLFTPLSTRGRRKEKVTL